MIKPFTNVLVGQDDLKKLIRSPHLIDRVVGFLSGFTTHELRSLCVSSGFNPAGFVATIEAYVANCHRTIGQLKPPSYRLRKLSRCQDLFSGERNAIATCEAVIDRARAVVDLWASTGGPTLLAEFEKKNCRPKVRQESAQQAAAPVVEVHPVFNIEIIQPKASGPQEVRVVAMPARSRTTGINRDESGEIVSSVCVETDLIERV